MSSSRHPTADASVCSFGPMPDRHRRAGIGLSRSGDRQPGRGRTVRRRPSSNNAPRRGAFRADATWNPVCRHAPANIMDSRLIVQGCRCRCRSTGNDRDDLRCRLPGSMPRHDIDQRIDDLEVDEVQQPRSSVDDGDPDTQRREDGRVFEANEIRAQQSVLNVDSAKISAPRPDGFRCRFRRSASRTAADLSPVFFPLPQSNSGRKFPLFSWEATARRSLPSFAGQSSPEKEADTAFAGVDGDAPDARSARSRSQRAIAVVQVRRVIQLAPPVVVDAQIVLDGPVRPLARRHALHLHAASGPDDEVVGSRAVRRRPVVTHPDRRSPGSGKLSSKAGGVGLAGVTATGRSRGDGSTPSSNVFPCHQPRSRGPSTPPERT